MPEGSSDERKQQAWEECHRVAEAVGMSEDTIWEDIDTLHKNGVRGREAGVALHEYYHPERHRPTRVNVKAILNHD